MLAEKRERSDLDRQQQRLKSLVETEVWKQDLKPFLLEKLTAAKQGILYDDGDLHWKSIGIYAHIEDFLVFVENIELEKALWEKKENPEKETKRTLLN